MITLYTFGPAFGLPDPSPFVVKADVLMKMSGLDYATTTGDVRKAPKGKLPFIVDDGVTIADSTLIRMHLEERRGIDFDAGLSTAGKATAWAAEKLCEDHLYWVVVRERWLDAANFEKGPRHYFDKVPFLIRPVITTMIKRQIVRTLHGQGLGRHSQTEIDKIGARGVSALAGLLGDKPWLTGDKPCGADATVWALVSSGFCELFRSSLGDEMRRHANLKAYRDRGLAWWYPDFPSHT